MKNFALVIIWSFLFVCLGLSLYLGLIAIFEFYKPERDLEIVLVNSLYSASIFLFGALTACIAESHLALRGIR